MPGDRRFFDALMAGKKLSMRALAARMGKTHSQLSLMFSGQRRMQLDEAVQLSEILGAPLHRIAEAAGVGMVRANGRRGYREGTYNLSGPVSADSVRLEWATPVLLARM